MTIPVESIVHKVSLHLVELIVRHKTSLSIVWEGAIEAGSLNPIFSLDHLLQGISNGVVLEDRLDQMDPRVVRLDQSLLVLEFSWRILQVWIEDIILEVDEEVMNLLNLLIEVGH